MNLLNKKCKACEDKKLKPFSKEEAQDYLDFAPGWFLSDPSTALGASALKIHKEFLFKDFVQAIRFINRVADIAEMEGHHPDIYVFYNKVNLELWTHAIGGPSTGAATTGGLSENDFILAAKIDDMLSLLGK